MNNFFTGLYRLLWYIVAVASILAAIIVTALRLAVPEIGSYKNAIQSLVSEYVNYPVQIKDISTGWARWVPNLRMHDIELYSKDNNSLIARFGNATLSIDLLSSIWQRRIVPHSLSITGFDIELTREVDGSISINSQTNNSNTVAAGDTELTAWLLSQHYITLEQASVRWKDEIQLTPVRYFPNVSLAIRTDRDRRQLDASLKLPEEYGGNLEVKIDINGDLLGHDWYGEIYVQANGIVGNELLRSTPANIRDGAADLRLWTYWKNAKPTKVIGDIGLQDFVLIANQYRLPVKSLNVDFSAERQQQKNWFINAKIDSVETVSGQWPASNHQVLLTKNKAGAGYRYTGNFSFLRLQEVLPSLIASGLLSENYLQKLDMASIQGDLKNIRVSGNTGDAAEPISFQAIFNDLTLKSADQVNSVSKLDGSVQIARDNVYLQLNSDQTEVTVGQLYEKSMMLIGLDANVQFNLTDNPELVIQKLSFVANDTPFELNGRINFTNQSPFVDLIARFGQTDLERLPEYLPRQTHGKLKKWFGHAFVGGSILSSDLLFRGVMDQFPFDNDEGVFKAIFNVSDARLNYEKDWPYLDNLTAEVIINNDDLFISASSGYIFDAGIKQLTVRADDFVKNYPDIIVNGRISGQTTDALLFINQSPLQENATLHDLAQMDITGDIDLDLKLDIPLDGGDIWVDGGITFSNAALESHTLGLELEGINGKVDFARHKVSGSDIHALYHGNPILLTITFDNSGDGRGTYIINGQADKSFIMRELGIFFPALLTKQRHLFDYLEGDSNWSVAIDNYRAETGVLHRNILIESQLQGIAIDAPEPLAKTSAIMRPIIIKTQMFDDKLDQIDITYDDLFKAKVFVDSVINPTVAKIDIAVGDGQQLPTSSNDIIIHGTLDKINLDDWVAFLYRNNKKTKASLDSDGRGITVDLNIANMILLGQNYKDTHFTIIDEQDSWVTAFDSADIKGTARFTSATAQLQDKLDIDLDHMEIKRQKKNGQNKRYDMDLNWIPELDINIKDLVYHDKKLGETHLITNKQKGLMLIKSLAFNLPDIAFNAKGKWEAINGVDKSELDISISSATLTGLSQVLFREAASVKGGNTNIKASVNWMGNPMNFQMEKASGKLDIEVGKGQLLNVEHFAGRLLGLLSITTLPRRLSLDFSDLFNKGFAFDSIEGSFSIQNGQAYTDNLSMIAPSADIYITGRTDLVTEDYDQIATVTPKITSNLPVASTLLGPVGLGIGTAIYLAGEIFDSIPKQINKALSYQYSITGSWDNPSIEKIKEENPDG